jgi:hypothetical protein
MADKAKLQQAIKAAAAKFADENYRFPTENDRLILENAMMTGIILFMDFQAGEFSVEHNHRGQDKPDPDRH